MFSRLKQSTMYGDWVAMNTCRDLATRFIISDTSVMA